jgi:GH43 family beta-xylosidase
MKKTLRCPAALPSFGCVLLLAACTGADAPGGEQANSQADDADRATFTNPLNDSGPDPWVTWYDGHYYLAATTWGDASVGLTMRKAETIQGLKDAEPRQIWQDETEDRCCNFWAPEFFLLDGPNGTRWYGYFTGGAAGDDFVNTQFMHVIESEGTDPLGPYTYKGKHVERNALDGTVLQLDGKMYAVYSVWNETQDLAIREMSSPWETVGEETTLSEPTYDWERQTGTVNEGPIALQRGGRTWIVYAASACWGPDYKLGLLTYLGGDPLDVGSWKKNAEPVFERADDRSVFAPGHNTFFKSPDGTEDWMAYHANDEESDVCDMGRTPRIQKFTWNDDGTPNFGTPVAAGDPLPVPSRGGGK